MNEITALPKTPENEIIVRDQLSWAKRRFAMALKNSRGNLNNISLYKKLVLECENWLKQNESL